MALADLDALYDRWAARLERIVRLDVRAPDPVVEDACQFAWSRLASSAGRVRSDSALSWLAKTAIHEAIKLLRRGGRDLSLELAVQESPGILGTAMTAGPDELVEYHERLDSIATLPERQQQMLWLQGVGFSYDDIASRTGCTNRTVERQLLRAKRTLREGA